MPCGVSHHVGDDFPWQTQVLPNPSLAGHNWQALCLRFPSGGTSGARRGSMRHGWTVAPAAAPRPGNLRPVREPGIPAQAGTTEELPPPTRSVGRPWKSNRPRTPSPPQGRNKQTSSTPVSTVAYQPNTSTSPLVSGCDGVGRPQYPNHPATRYLACFAISCAISFWMYFSFGQPDTSA